MWLSPCEVALLRVCCTWLVCFSHQKQQLRNCWDGRSWRRDGVVQDSPRPRGLLEDKKSWLWPWLWCLGLYPSHSSVINELTVRSLYFISLQDSDCASLNFEVTESVFLFYCFEHSWLGSTSLFDLLYIRSKATLALTLYFYGHWPWPCTCCPQAHPYRGVERTQSFLRTYRLSIVDLTDVGFLSFYRRRLSLRKSLPFRGQIRTPAVLCGNSDTKPGVLSLCQPSHPSCFVLTLMVSQRLSCIPICILMVEGTVIVSEGP